MASPSDRDSQFRKPFRRIPWIWLIVLVASYAVVGKILAIAPYWYFLITIATGFYSTLAKPKWAFSFSTIWWLLFLESLAEVFVASTILYYSKPLRWPRPSGGSILFDLAPVIIGLAILVLVKFFLLVFFPITRVIYSKLSKITSQPMRLLVWVIPFLVSLTTAAAASWHWHLFPELYQATLFSYTAIRQLILVAVSATALALIYTIAQVLVVAPIVVSAARAGAKLKQSFTKFHTFLILAVISGFGLGAGWLLNLIYP